MAEDTQIDNADHVQVSLALERACNELEALSSSLGRLQSTIPQGITALSPSLCRELQSLDHVHQHLDELRSYLLSISALANPEWAIDIRHATADIRLALMIERLHGLHARMGGAHDDTGEMELLA